MAAKQRLMDFVDLRDITDDPFEALSRSDGRSVMIDVPLAKVRNLGPLAFAVTRMSGDPFVGAVQDYVADLCRTYAGSRLEWFYARWRPANAAVLLGLSEEEASAALVECGPPGFVYPWQAKNPHLKELKKLESVRQENITKGADIQGTEGCVWAGPFSKRKGELEFARLRLLADAMSKYGCAANRANTVAERDSINGVLMVRGEDWCVLGGNGNHRRAVLAGLGWSHVPVCVRNKIIRREEVASWRSVRKALFTEEQALRIFDRMFEGRQPNGCPSIGEADDLDAAGAIAGGRRSYPIAGSATRHGPAN
jgi:hypothetical protein